MSIRIKLPTDFTKIDVNDLGEVIWWSNHFGISPEKLLSIINKVGTSSEEVIRYKSKKNGSSPVRQPES
jgi:hypothetical protein